MGKELKRSDGIVDYSVITECPHCGGYLDLTKPPYSDDDDELGLMVFGTIDKPAKWDDINLEYSCKHCEKEFIVDQLVY